MSSVQQNLSYILDKIAKSAIKSGRHPNDIKLIAISKFHSQESIQDVIHAGHKIFGENRIQEAKTKFAPLQLLDPELTLHFVGPLQTNKVLDAVKLASVIETLDRTALFAPLEKAMDKTGLKPIFYIQINVGNEPQKAGVRLEKADEFISACLRKFNKQIQGIMGIPPLNQPPEIYFDKLRNFAERYNLPEISMGMSSDFETAIAHGATVVRIGSAIFGERQAHKISK
ncbi:Pyridoxal phosphate homeostasis protein [Commensalibacter sp. Nvir]|uniref:YggS family pyridoxal phosphate-dependent enzyme n=1 Tax=Commensalibacter sp. Nvir TaxID=3069817 RepID=UPI002D684D2E|nr:Pyridoxal phosphate homeostasis protein [Commensalibacter sp. Nvir]